MIDLSPSPISENPVPISERGTAGPLLGTAAFYDKLAPSYDAMTDPAQRFVRERPFFSMLMDKYQIHTVLDAGAGTGFHSLLLARLGANVTAVDCSPLMLAELERKAGLEGANIECVLADLRNLPVHFSHKTVERFDAVFCMGNTLAHAENFADLAITLAGMYEILRPGGTVFVQMLNYDRIQVVKPEVIAERTTETASFVRSYTYDTSHSPANQEPEQIRFTVSSTPTAPSARNTLPTMLQTSLQAFRPAELMTELGVAGFRNIQLYGSISLGLFDAANSKDVLLIAQK